MYTLTRDQKKKGLEVQKPFLKRFLVAPAGAKHPRMGLVPSFAPHWPHPGAEQASEARAQHSPALSQPELYTQKPQITGKTVSGAFGYS